MTTVGDVLATASGRTGPAFDAPDLTGPSGYPPFCRGAWKAGNLLRQYGVGPEALVAVDFGTSGARREAPDPYLATLGALTLGAEVDLAPDDALDARALVAPVDRLDAFDAGPRCTRLAYGGRPSDPRVVHFERERWSENPVPPPETVEPTTLAIADPSRSDVWTHADLLSLAERAVAATGLEAGDRVGLRETPDGPRVAAAVLAPLSVGATIVAGDPTDCDVVVGADGDFDPAALSP